MNTKKLAVCTKCWLPINRVSDNVGSHARVDFGDCANQPRLGRKEPNMIIIGMDYHPSFQQIALVDSETGEYQESRLQHREEAEKFYRDLATRDVKVRVGMEASGQARWFERLLAELIHAGQISASAKNKALPEAGTLAALALGWPVWRRKEEEERASSGTPFPT